MTQQAVPSNSQNSLPEPVESKWGCLSVVLLILIIFVVGFLLLLAGLIGGFGSFLVARFFSFSSIPTAIAAGICGGIAGSLGAIAGPPAGWLITYPGNTDSKTARVTAAFVVGLLSPFIHFNIVVLSFFLAAFGSVFAMNVHEPGRAALWTAVGAPLAGFILGASTGGPSTLDQG